MLAFTLTHHGAVAPSHQQTDTSIIEQKTLEVIEQSPIQPNEQLIAHIRKSIIQPADKSTNFRTSLEEKRTLKDIVHKYK